jgi:hypothetical protein
MPLSPKSGRIHRQPAVAWFFGGSNVRFNLHQGGCSTRRSRTCLSPALGTGQPASTVTLSNEPTDQPDWDELNCRRLSGHLSDVVLSKRWAIEQPCLGTMLSKAVEQLDRQAKAAVPCGRQLFSGSITQLSHAWQHQQGALQGESRLLMSLRAANRTQCQCNCGEGPLTALQTVPEFHHSGPAMSWYVDALSA